MGELGSYLKEVERQGEVEGDGPTPSWRKGTRSIFDGNGSRKKELKRVQTNVPFPSLSPQL